MSYTWSRNLTEDIPDLPFPTGADPEGLPWHFDGVTVNYDPDDDAYLWYCDCGEEQDLYDTAEDARDGGQRHVEDDCTI